jgi:hypothetical protein
VRLAQRLLAHALAEPGAHADGRFSAATTDAIERFQAGLGRIVALFYRSSTLYQNR